MVVFNEMKAFEQMEKITEVFKSLQVLDRHYLSRTGLFP